MLWFPIQTICWENWIYSNAICTFPLLSSVPVLEVFKNSVTYFTKKVPIGFSKTDTLIQGCPTTVPQTCHKAWACLHQPESKWHQWRGVCLSFSTAMGPLAAGSGKHQTAWSCREVAGGCGGGVPGRRKDREMVERGRHRPGRGWNWQGPPPPNPITCVGLSSMTQGFLGLHQ